MRSLNIAITALFLITLASGCAAVTEATGLAAFKPNPNGPEDPGDDPDTDWNSIGREARSGQFVEYENDGHWFDSLSSERARSIERSVGVFR